MSAEQRNGQPTPRGDNVTTIYRAYSPSRDDHGKVHTDEDRAAGDVSVLNQAARAFSAVDDWRIQTGTITWEES